MHQQEQQEEAPDAQEHTHASDKQYNTMHATDIQAHAQDIQQQHVLEHAEVTVIVELVAVDKHQQEQQEEAQRAQEHTRAADNQYNTTDATEQADADTRQQRVPVIVTVHVILEVEHVMIQQMQQIR